MRSIELWGALAPLRISRFRVWCFAPSRNDGVNIGSPEVGLRRTRVSATMPRNNNDDAGSASMSIRKSLFITIAAIAAAFSSAQAQNFPTRPITLVIPFAPGGSTTIVGRGVAEKMSELLGEKIIVDNRPGAGGTVGTRAVAKSEPDGYTLLLGYTGTLAIGPSLYKNV